MSIFSDPLTFYAMIAIYAPTCWLNTQIVARLDISITSVPGIIILSDSDIGIILKMQNVPFSASLLGFVISYHFIHTKFNQRSMCHN